MTESQAAELAELLSTGTWPHDYPITADTAKSLGLHVTTAMPNDILELMSLYPQPVRNASSVEYLPIPKGRRANTPSDQ